MEKKEINVKIGARLKELIKEKGWKQKDFADKVHVSKQQINNYCSGLYDLRSHCDEFARVLGVSTDYLLCNSDYKTMEEGARAIGEKMVEEENHHMSIQDYILRICEEKGFHFPMSTPFDLWTRNDVPVFFSSEIEPHTRGKLTEEEKEKGTLFSTDLKTYHELLEDIESYIDLRLQLLYKRSTHKEITPAAFRGASHIF